MASAVQQVRVPGGGGTITPERRVALEQSLARAVEWVLAHEYRGYEPADGNLSPLFRLTRGRVLPMRVLQQAVLRAPVNIRPLLGIRPHESAIARGYMAWAFLTIEPATDPGNGWSAEANRCLRWLIQHRAPGHAEYCWGDPYEYATRAGRRPSGEPLLIWTALIGHAFLDAYERLHMAEHLDVARSIGRWILRLPAERTASGRCLSYVAFRQSSIHNASITGAAFLARLSRVTGDPAALDVAQDAVRYTCARQRRDGSWLYGEERKYHWIDSFHTGYNLTALETYRRASQDATFDRHLAAGLEFFRSRFFEQDGRPKYFHDRTYPIDIQCAAQAIDTFAALARHDGGGLSQALATAEWTVRRMQAPDGHFCYRDLGWTRVTTPMMHWGQATMIKALASLLHALEVDRA